MSKDEIWELKPEEKDGPGEKEEPLELKEADEPDRKKETPELINIDEGGQKPSPPEEEGVYVAREESKTVAGADKPQVIEPGDEKEKGKKSAKMPELKGGEGKKIERARPAASFVSAPEKSKLLTVGLALVFILVSASVALLALPLFGIWEIPEELPVLSHVIDFYRSLPIFPD